MAKRAKQPFEFIGCVELRQMLGQVAWDERELVSGIEETPGDSIYYHTHSYFLRSRLVAGPYPSDFATWAAIQVRDRVLGERLGVVDPYEYHDVDSLRAELIDIIDAHLSALHSVPRVVYGEPFHFMRSTVIEVPTRITAYTLTEFRDALARVDLSVIYYHFFEPPKRRRHDAAAWLAKGIGMESLATAVARLNPYVSSLDQFRAKLIAACDVALNGT